MILFCLIVNKQGRIRLRRNYQHVEEKEREMRDTAIINKCLMRSKKQCNFLSHDNVTVVYKTFTTLTLICGTTKDESLVKGNNFGNNLTLSIRFAALCAIAQACAMARSVAKHMEKNELAIQELLNVFMDCIGTYFQHVCELDIVYNIERVYIILDELIINGCIAYTSKERVLVPLQLIDAGS